MEEDDAHARGELLERSVELAALGELIQSARDGRGSVGLIEGDAGIGKTSLLEAAIELATSSGVRVLRARAGQLEREVGWNLVRQLFDAVIRTGPRPRKLPKVRRHSPRPRWGSVPAVTQGRFTVCIG